MSLLHPFGLLTRPRAEWAAIHDRRYGVARSFLLHTALYALIPAIAGYLGTTRTGWQIGTGDVVRLTEESALRIAVLYYLAMLAATFCVAWMIHWMSRTYGANQPLGQCYALATYTATPLFLVGAMQLQPILWLNLVVGLPVLGYTVFIFYTGVPDDDGDPRGAGLPVLLRGDGVRPGRAGGAARHQRPAVELGIRPELHPLIPRGASEERAPACSRRPTTTPWCASSR